MPIIYSGIFVDNPDELKKKYPPVHPNEYYHHATIEFKPKSIDNIPVGETIRIPIIGRVTTDKVDTLVIKSDKSFNKYPHITLSTAEGIKPFASNEEIQSNLNKIVKLNDSIQGTYGYFEDGKVIKEGKKMAKKLMTKSKNPCQKGYMMYGMKMKNGRKVPNCAPIKENHSCEECSMPQYVIETKKDYSELVKLLKEIIRHKDSLVEIALPTNRNIQLGKVMNGDIKKYKMFLQNPEGQIVKLHFGNSDHQHDSHQCSCHKPQMQSWCSRNWSPRMTITKMLGF